MTRIRDNSRELEQTYVRIAQRIPRARDNIARDLALEVHRKMQALLSGSPGSPTDRFPVANITGNLFRSADAERVGPGNWMVLNTAAYAGAIATGEFMTPHGNPYMVTPRAFHTEALRRSERRPIYRRRMGDLLQ